MPLTYVLPGYQANPAWINNELCGDSSHNVIPEEAQAFIRRGCCLPQKSVGRYVNGTFIRTFQHRSGVPQQKVDEDMLAKEDAKVAENGTAKEEAEKENVAEGFTSQAITKDDAFKQTAFEQTATNAEASKEMIQKEIAMDDRLEHTAAERDDLEDNAEKQADEVVATRNERAGVKKDEDDRMAMCKDECKDGGESDEEDDFEIVEGGGQSEQDVHNKKKGLLRKFVSALTGGTL